MITFSMSDVPVDASDDMIKASALGHITDDLEKGTGVIKAVDSEGSNVCIIAIDSIKKFIACPKLSFAANCSALL